MKILLLVLVLANYSSFYYSTIRVFAAHPEKQSTRLKLLRLNTIALWLGGLFVIFQAPSTPHHWIIIAIQFLCLVGFWSTSRIAKQNGFTAVFSKDTPVKLVRSGLYRYVRHPFYTIYLACYGSVAFVTFSPFYTALFLGIACLYVLAARTEEEKFKSSALGDEHERYAMRTGMFFPKIRLRTTN